MAKAAATPRGQNKLREALENFDRERSSASSQRPSASAPLKVDLDDPVFRTLVGAALVIDPTLLTRIAALVPHAEIKPANQLRASNPLRQTLSALGPRDEERAATVAAVDDLGILVRRARQDMGLSQQAFADLAGLGRRFVSELESGKATLEIGRVLRACAAAGIDLMARVRTKP